MAAVNIGDRPSHPVTPSSAYGDLQGRSVSKEEGCTEWITRQVQEIWQSILVYLEQAWQRALVFYEGLSTCWQAEPVSAPASPDLPPRTLTPPSDGRGTRLDLSMLIQPEYTPTAAGAKTAREEKQGKAAAPPVIAERASGSGGSSPPSGGSTSSDGWSPVDMQNPGGTHHRSRSFVPTFIRKLWPF